MTTDRTTAASACRELEDAHQALQRARQRVQQIERDCDHKWKIENKPIYTAVHTIPGDPPGTMGVAPVTFQLKLRPAGSERARYVERRNIPAQSKKKNKALRLMMEPEPQSK